MHNTDQNNHNNDMHIRPKIEPEPGNPIDSRAIALNGSLMSHGAQWAM